MDDRNGRLRAVSMSVAARQLTRRKASRSSRPPALQSAAPVSVVDTSDIDLFRAAVVDAKPLADPGRLPPAPPSLRPVPLQRWADDRAALADSLSDHVGWEFDLQNGEQLAFKRDGISPEVFRKLRRGHWIVQGEVDLHGLTRDEARPHLAAFLAACVRRGMRCVRVIHGKGLGSRNREPVLKAKVANWLAQRDEVLAFCEAPPRDGGAGAAFVLLKTKPR